MEKGNLKPGKKYLHHRKLVIDGRDMEAERWVRYLEPTQNGGLFEHEYERFELSEEEITEEIIQ